MGYIYKITNTKTNKCYIGQSIQPDINKRWRTHINLAKLNKGCPVLKEAIKKYGINNFVFQIIIICFDEDRLKYEKEYIKKYNSLVPNGYNILEGGQERGFEGLHHTVETKEKISNAVKKRFSNTEERIKASEKYKSINIDNRIIISRENSDKWIQAKKEKRVGKRINIINPTNETKQKISESLKEYYKNNQTVRKGPKNKEKHSEIMTRINGRKVLQYSLENVLLASFDSITLASKHTGIGRRSIQANTAGKSKTSGGFIWKYAQKEPKQGIE